MTFVQMLACRETFSSRNIRLTPTLLDLIPDPSSVPVRDCPLKPRPLSEVLLKIDALRTDQNPVLAMKAGRFDVYKHWLRPMRAYKGA